MTCHEEGAKETPFAFGFVQSHAPTDGPETGEAAPPMKLAGPPALDVVLWSNIATVILDSAAFCSAFLPFLWGGCGVGCSLLLLLLSFLKVPMLVNAEPVVPGQPVSTGTVMGPSCLAMASAQLKICKGK